MVESLTEARGEPVYAVVVSILHVELIGCVYVYCVCGVSNCLSL